MKNKVTPVLRIFDYNKAVEFYIDWLEFKIDWKHVFEEGFPLYTQISKDGAELHLSEHHGDCSPGAKVLIMCDDIKSYHSLLINKKYKFNKPRLEKAEWAADTFTAIDPFGNTLLFFQYDGTAKINFQD
ncbi:glyoxalase superfamily protein [soil metagenome]